MEANPHFKPALPPDGTHLAVNAWNLMGGVIDWAALPVVVEMFGVDDVDSLVRDLVTIREYNARKSGA